MGKYDRKVDFPSVDGLLTNKEIANILSCLLMMANVVLK